jgi:hypothetical protein
MSVRTPLQTSGAGKGHVLRTGVVCGAPPALTVPAVQTGSIFS